MNHFEHTIKRRVRQAEKYYREIEEYYSHLDLQEAVKYAAEGRIPISCRGSRTSFAEHQYRVGKDNCKIGAQKLLSIEYLNAIRNATCFEDIFRVTEDVRL